MDENMSLLLELLLTERVIARANDQRREWKEGLVGDLEKQTPPLDFFTGRIIAEVRSARLATMAALRQ